MYNIPITTCDILDPGKALLTSHGIGRGRGLSLVSSVPSRTPFGLVIFEPFDYVVIVYSPENSALKADFYQRSHT